MAIHFKEINHKTEDLIEQGKQAENKINTCKSRVSQATADVAAAARALERASETDENGNPAGDVGSAQANLNVAKNQLAASKRALAEAQSNLEKVNESKKTLAEDIKAHNNIERANLQKLEQLKGMAFAESSNGLTEGIAERLNEAEDARAKLLESLGIHENVDHVKGGGAGSVSLWDTLSSGGMLDSGSKDAAGNPEGAGGAVKLAVDTDESRLMKSFKTAPAALGAALSSLIDPLKSDVKKWNDYRDKVSDSLNGYCKRKYGNVINPVKLNKRLADTTVFESASTFKLRGLNPRVLGYNDASKSHVRVGSGHEKQTLVHENFHQLSANNNRRGIIVSDIGTETRRNVQANEAITELLTQRALGTSYGPDYSAYSENRDAMRVLESALGEDVVAEAYFQNRPELISDKLDNVLGPGTWEDLSNAFDDCMSDIYHTANSGRVRRDNIINRYLMAVTKPDQGEDKWINSFI